MKIAAPAKLASKLLLVSALAGACVLLPAVTIHATQSDHLWGFSLNNQHLGSIATPTGNIRLRVNGDMLINQHETDIKEIDGTASIVEKRGAQTRRIDFSSDAQHQLQRRYWLDDKEHALDADARQWLASVLPVVLRETGIDAEKRAARLYRQGGAEALLGEIEKIEAANVRGTYIRQLSKTVQLTPVQLSRLLGASATMDSDFDLRTTLQSVLERQKLDAEGQVAILRLCAGKMGSSFEQRTLLQAFAPRLLPEDAVTKAWQTAVEKIDSDFEARLAITSLVSRDTLTSGQIGSAFHASQKLSSDFEHRLVLEALAKKLNKSDAGLIGQYLKSAQQINSDFERRVAFMALIEKAGLSKNGYEQLLHSLREMNSDFEVCTVLKEVAKTMPHDQDLVARYHQVASNLGDFERQQAESALRRML